MPLYTSRQWRSITMRVAPPNGAVWTFPTGQWADWEQWEESAEWRRPQIDVCVACLLTVYGELRATGALVRGLGIDGYSAAAKVAYTCAGLPLVPCALALLLQLGRADWHAIAKGRVPLPFAVFNGMAANVAMWVACLLAVLGFVAYARNQLEKGSRVLGSLATNSSTSAANHTMSLMNITAEEADKGFALAAAHPAVDLLWRTTFVFGDALLIAAFGYQLLLFAVLLVGASARQGCAPNREATLG